MDQIYIVEGRVGEFDDAREWQVHAYEDEEMAKAHAERANARSRELAAELRKLEAQSKSPFDRIKAIESLKNEHDPDRYLSFYADEPPEYIYYPVPFTAKQAEV